MTEAFERQHIIPGDARAIEAAAAEAGLSIPEACMIGVAANLDLLRRHAETLLGTPDTAR